MALGPGPAGLKFWSPQGLTADNTADINDLPAGATNWFNPWGPRRPVQDFVRGTPPQYMAAPFTLTSDAGSYSITGAAAILALRHSADTGSYTITGSIAALTVNDPVNLPAGANWSNPWGPRRGRQDWTWGSIPPVPVVLTAAGGSYALTGSAALFGFGQVGPSGAYALTGSAAAQAFGQVAGAGSYTLTGSAAATAIGQAAASGSYALTGSAATFAFGQGVPAGAYTLTGADAAFLMPGGVDYLPAGITGSYVPWRRPHPVSLLTSTSRVLGAAVPVILTADGGSYTITGSAASLTVTEAGNLPAGAVNWYNPWGRRAAIGLRTWINPAGVPVSYIFRQPLITRIWARPPRPDWIWSIAYLAPITFPAAAGAYNLTGSDANLTQAGTITLTCGAGSYAITGFSVNFVGVTPPVEVTPPTPGGAGVKVGRGGRPLYKRLKLKKKRKREECEELLEYLESLPPLAEIERADLPPSPTTLSLLDCIPPLSRPQVLAAINKTPIRDDDDDEDAIALLLEFL